MVVILILYIELHLWYYFRLLYTNIIKIYVEKILILNFFYLAPKSEFLIPSLSSYKNNKQLFTLLCFVVSLSNQKHGKNCVPRKTSLVLGFHIAVWLFLPKWCNACVTHGKITNLLYISLSSSCIEFSYLRELYAMNLNKAEANHKLD